MTVLDIYHRFQNPVHLQLHQYQVALVAYLLYDHWLGDQLNLDLLIFSALLHDLGNLVKFKRPFVGALEVKAEYWQVVQNKMISQYGSDAKSATMQMIIEVGLENSVGKVLSDMDRILDGELNVIHEAQVVEFADLCVSPDGIVGYQLRKKDLIDRYGITHSLTWVESADLLCRTLQEKIEINLDEISKYDYSFYKNKLVKFNNRHIFLCGE